MDKEIVVRLHSSFEDMVRKHPNTGTELWCARDLQMLLGYFQWRSFAAVIDKAITACQNAGYEPRDHFAHVSKMVDLGSGAKREIENIALTRYACYLIAQNGDRLFWALQVYPDWFWLHFAGPARHRFKGCKNLGCTLVALDRHL